MIIFYDLIITLIRQNLILFLQLKLKKLDKKYVLKFCDVSHFKYLLNIFSFMFLLISFELKSFKLIYRE